jgi:D-lactate dehydrogenase
MKVFVYSTHSYDSHSLTKACKDKHELIFFDKKLSVNTACNASGCEAIALFTADDASAEVLEMLHSYGIRYVALRSAGYDHINLLKAKQLKIRAANVPAYSPYAIAEHAVAMLLAINRKIIQSQLLIQLQDFRLDNLTGFDVHGKTIGIIGTGKTGMAFARIMKGFGTTLLGYDPVPNEDAPAVGIKYVSLEELSKSSDIISLHCPLNEKTKNMIAQPQFVNMKKTCILINTSRGAIIKTEDLLHALESSVIGGACLDVYYKEKGIFFEDHRTTILNDSIFARLRSLKNVLITGHQAFLTTEALDGIAETTIQNLDAWQQGLVSPNELIA